MSKKGDRRELIASQFLHRKYNAVLVDPTFLRANSMGQIDIACIKENKLVVYEVKSSKRLSRRQRTRLQASVSYLGALLGREASLRLMVL